MKARYRLMWFAVILAVLTLGTVGTDFAINAGDTFALGLLGTVPTLLP